MIRRLPAEQTWTTCLPESLPFESTAELSPPPVMFAQPRAAAALELGVEIDHAGYHVFAYGTGGIDQRDLVWRFLQQRAPSTGAPSDWCCVFNFREPRQPKVLALPAGKALVLREQMQRFVDDLPSVLASGFESEEYQNRRQVIEEEFKTETEKPAGELEKEAREAGIAVLRTPVGIAFAPISEDEVLSPEEFNALTEDERARIEEKVAGFQKRFQKLLDRGPRLLRVRRQKRRELDLEVSGFAVAPLIDELRLQWSESQELATFLTELQKDVTHHAGAILQQGQSDEASPSGLGELGLIGTPLARYQVNVLVDHSASTGAPLIYEDNPTFANLFGRIEHVPRDGVLVTDFSLIHAGALQRASGGTLVLDARRVLSQPFAWEGLKRALMSRRVRIESPAEAMGLSLLSTVSLEPEPTPFDGKVVLVGEPILYYLLSALDPDFAELFKVAADFDDRLPREDETLGDYASWLASLAQENALRPFGREAVARVIDFSSRLAADAKKLSTQQREIADLMREADYWAKRSGHDEVARADVETAIEAAIFRSDRLRERTQEAMLRKTLLIDTEGAAVGQVNGLSVLQLGGFAFGRPSRITARVRLGRGEVLDIEREVELGGPLHSKGVLILTGFLGARFARERPLAMSASLVFEQSYGGIDGDSASSAELYALLSALAELPIKQSLAVTGSVNQQGRVQAIGGVNEKIEGFFDLCQSRGLTGEQGVLIPSSNVEHLMLRDEVVEAIAKGSFSVYSVDTVDEGIELLTGVEAGEPGEDGGYPEDTVCGRVASRLEQMAQRLSEFGQAGRGGQEREP